MADKPLTDIVSESMYRRCVTWRRYGLSGELRRPMFHRFEVKGGVTMLDAMTENMTNLKNSLFAKMSRK